MPQGGKSGVVRRSKNMPQRQKARLLACVIACVMAGTCGSVTAQSSAADLAGTSNKKKTSSSQPSEPSQQPASGPSGSQPAPADSGSSPPSDSSSSSSDSTNAPPATPAEQEQNAATSETPSEQSPSTNPADTGQLDTIPVDTAAAAPPSSNSTQLEEIQVTAQKRVESLQATPISVSAFNAEKLEARGIANILDLGSHVPGMQIEPFPINISTLRIFIRGIGTLDAQFTQDPAIGIYLDGVYLGRMAGLSFDVADLERIEVLRGPQGTLYGRNTVGGAVNLITRKPSTSGFDMSHKFSTGDRGYMAGRSMVNIPILDNLATKIVVLSSQKEGYVENSGPGGDFGDREDTALRADLRYEPVDWLTADYAFDHTTITHFQYMYQAQLPPNVNHGQAEQFKRYGESQTIYSTSRLGSMSSGANLEPSTVRINGHALTLTGGFGDYELKYTGSMRTIFDKAYADLSGGLDTTGGQGNPNYRLDPGYYDGPVTQDTPQNCAGCFEAVGGPVPIAWLRNYQEQTSHELQFIGDFFDDQVKLIGGMFLFEEEGFDDRCGSAGTDCTHKQTHQFHTFLQPNGFPAPIEQRVTNLVLVYRTDIHNESSAYFSQATWTPAFDLLEKKLHLTLGYRHTVDDREALKNYVSRIYQEDVNTGEVQDITNAAGTCQGPNSTGQSGNDDFFDERVARSFSNDSYAFIGAYDVTPDINAYAKYVQAYKSGGFDTRDPQIDGTRQSSDCTTYGLGFRTGFKPELVDSTELGVKSEWFGRSLRVNMTVFDMDYHDRQISALLQGAIQDTKTRNVGRSRIKGVELETMWAAAPGLITSLEYEYLDAKTIEVLDINGNNVAQNYQPYSAPKNSYSGSIDWTVMRFGWGDLHSYLNYNHVDRRNGQTLPNRVGLTALSAYSVLSTRFSLEGLPVWGRGRMDVALWGRNLLDEEYEYSAIDNLPQADRSVIWAEPRTYGADLIYRWN
jgi:iron complex outermembrane recepter protein